MDPSPTPTKQLLGDSIMTAITATNHHNNSAMASSAVVTPPPPPTMAGAKATAVVGESSEAISKHDLQAMKDMIGDIKKDPSLLYRLSTLPGGQTNGNAAAAASAQAASNSNSTGGPAAGGGRIAYIDDDDQASAVSSLGMMSHSDYNLSSTHSFGDKYNASNQVGGGHHGMNKIPPGPSGPSIKHAGNQMSFAEATASAIRSANTNHEAEIALRMQSLRFAKYQNQSQQRGGNSPPKNTGGGGGGAGMITAPPPTTSSSSFVAPVPPLQRADTAPAASSPSAKFDNGGINNNILDRGSRGGTNITRGVSHDRNSDPLPAPQREQQEQQVDERFKAKMRKKLELSSSSDEAISVSSMRSKSSSSRRSKSMVESDDNSSHDAALLPYDVEEEKKEHDVTTAGGAGAVTTTQAATGNSEYYNYAANMMHHLPQHPQTAAQFYHSAVSKYVVDERKRSSSVHVDQRRGRGALVGSDNEEQKQQQYVEKNPRRSSSQYVETNPRRSSSVTAGSRQHRRSRSTAEAGNNSFGARDGKPLMRKGSGGSESSRQTTSSKGRSRSALPTQRSAQLRGSQSERRQRNSRARSAQPKSRGVLDPPSETPRRHVRQRSSSAVDPPPLRIDDADREQLQQQQSSKKELPARHDERSRSATAQDETARKMRNESPFTRSNSVQCSPASRQRRHSAMPVIQGSPNKEKQLHPMAVNAVKEYLVENGEEGQLNRLPAGDDANIHNDSGHLHATDTLGQGLAKLARRDHHFGGGHHSSHESESGKSVISRLSNLVGGGRKQNTHLRRSVNRSVSSGDIGIASSGIDLGSSFDYLNTVSTERSDSSDGHPHDHLQQNGSHHNKEHKSKGLAKRIAHFSVGTTSPKAHSRLTGDSSHDVSPRRRRLASDGETLLPTSSYSSSMHILKPLPSTGSSEDQKLNNTERAAVPEDSDHHRPYVVNDSNHLTAGIELAIRTGTVPRLCDERGRCLFHPHIRLQKPKLFGGWKVLFKHCPDCAVEHMKKTQEKLAEVQKEKKRQRRKSHRKERESSKHHEKHERKEKEKGKMDPIIGKNVGDEDFIPKVESGNSKASSPTKKKSHHHHRSDRKRGKDRRKEEAPIERRKEEAPEERRMEEEAYEERRIEEAACEKEMLMEEIMASPQAMSPSSFMAVMEEENIYATVSDPTAATTAAARALFHQLQEENDVNNHQQEQLVVEGEGAESNNYYEYNEPLQEPQQVVEEPQPLESQPMQSQPQEELQPPQPLPPHDDQLVAAPPPLDDQPVEDPTANSLALVDYKPKISKKKRVNGLPWSDYNGHSGRYTGEVNEQYLPHGRGEMVYDRGVVSSGIWYSGVLDTEGGMEEEDVGGGGGGNGGGGGGTSHALVPLAEYTPDSIANYSMGDKGKDEDMIIDGQEETSQAVSELRPNDAAFVRRSDGSWTYAVVKDRTSGEKPTIRFKVNVRGSTKAFPTSQWGTYVRRVKLKRLAEPKPSRTLGNFLDSRNASRNNAIIGSANSVAGNLLIRSHSDAGSVGSAHSAPMMNGAHHTRARSMDNLTTGKMNIRTRSRSRSRGRKKITTLPLLFSSSMSVSEEHDEGHESDDWETASGSGYRLRGIDP